MKVIENSVFTIQKDTHLKVIVAYVKLDSIEMFEYELSNCHDQKDQPSLLA